MTQSRSLTIFTHKKEGGSAMRVKVMSGDGSQLVGYGQYVGDVTVYVVVMPDESLRSLKNAEVRPSDAELAELGGTLEVIEENPKIVLDDGTIVYGCQVWWEEAPEVHPN